MKKCLKITLASMVLSAPMIGNEQHIVIEDSSGATQELNVHEDASFGDVIRVLDQELYVAERQRDVIEDDTMPAMRAMQVNILVSNNGFIVKAVSKTSASQRDYYAAVTQQNKDDIYFIVKTLADASLVKIKGQESALKSAGDRINLVHPLRFLATVFSNEELKVCMRNLEGRSWVWKNFIKGLVDTLTEESALNNVLPFANDFASQISVNTSLFMPTMQSGQWTKFISVLIEGVPRQGQTNRHDM